MSQKQALVVAENKKEVKKNRNVKTLVHKRTDTSTRKELREK